MALDTSIIRQATFRPIQFETPSQANMLAEAAQAVSGLQTLESNRMRMAQMRQEQAREQQVAAGLKQVSAMGESPEMLKAYEDVLLQSGDPKLMDAGMKMRAVRITEARNKQGYETWLRGGQPAAAQPAAAPVDNALALGVETPAEPAAVGSQNMLAQAPAAPADPFAAQRQRYMAGLGSNIPAVVEASKSGLAALPRLEMPKTPEDAPEAKLMKALGLPLTLEGYTRLKQIQQSQDRLLSPAEEAQRVRIAQASRPPPQPKEPSAPIAVVDEATGKVKYVTREEAMGRTPASAMEGLPPKEIQRRESVFPQAKQSVATVSNTMSTIEQTIDRLLKNAEGLNGVTGLVYGRTPAVTKEARVADADLEQLANLAFVQGITELRASSKTGAGVGNVSNREGDRFENLKASLKRTQSYDDMVAALKRLKAQATSTKDIVNTEFTDMYSYRQGRAAPASAAAPAAGNFPAPPAAAIEALKRGQGTDAEFDAIFGPGAAARARGR
jgi:hypothetical protein